MNPRIELAIQNLERAIDDMQDFLSQNQRIDCEQALRFLRDTLK